VRSSIGHSSDLSRALPVRATGFLAGLHSLTFLGGMLLLAGVCLPHPGLSQATPKPLPEGITLLDVTAPMHL
jgi:hypothetical protein